ncbi:hypothetical protein [Aeromonas salmonicida]|uniref:hypothetical protein n=1 Tax=Aeromonas salmonicida TaxID=645 RepID=UPI001BAA3CD2|nr:hypothetical protein [Aeromonas salmonicida]MBS2781732.1 hypothetical protein [Aeromonas salmonicida]
MDQSDQNIEEHYRKNLMIVAATVSIYSIAGGGFDTELAIAGAKLKFTNPQYLEYASIIVLLFLWWRHWLVSHAGRKSFNFALTCNVVAPKEIHEKVGEILEAKALEARKALVGGYLKPNYLQRGLSIHSVGLLKISYKLVYEHGVEKKEPEIMYFSLFFEPIAFVKLNYNYRKEWLWLVLFDTRFGDSILPSVVTLIALVSYSYNYFTR